MTQAPDLARMTDAELEAALSGAPLADASAGALNPDWTRIRVAWPGAKTKTALRLDDEIINWFRADGPGYQTRINAVLRAFVQSQRRRG